MVGAAWSQKIRGKGTVIALLGGLILVAVWTLLRLFTDATRFDTVSQQVIVHQWLHGDVSTAHMGQTAYVLKMLVLYIPLELLPGLPRLKLILATLVVNLIAFLLIAVLLKRLLGFFEITARAAYGSSLVWLAAIAGSVFWIGFINSRNLEVAGGLYLLYLSLRYTRSGGWRQAMSIAAFAGLLFFADPLQAYMIAVPAVLYSAFLSRATVVGRYRTRTLRLLGSVIAGYAVSKILFVVLHHVVHLSFSETGGLAAPDISAHWISMSAAGILHGTITLFAGAADAGRAREVCNIALLLLTISAGAYTFWRRAAARRILLLVAVVFVMDELVYAISGQAAQPDTSRYLIMIAPMAALGLSAVRLPRRATQTLVVLFAAGAVLNAAALTATLVRSWDNTFPKGAHLASVFRYTQKHPAVQSYASIDTALPAMYLHNLPAQKVLPVGCLNGSLTRTYYSMDRAYQKAAGSPSRTIALIMDGTAITNTPSVCTISSLTASLGQPIGIDTTDDDSTVLLFRQSALNRTLR